MNVNILLVVSFYLFISVSCRSKNNSRKRSKEEEYYLNYDYDTKNSSANFDFTLKSPLLPNPESIDSKYTVDVLPKIELPDDSLADTDLKDHDFIDNIMYVYYGSHNRNGRSYGAAIIIIGSVLSCAAQLLTIFCVLFKKNVQGKREMKCLFLHMMVTFCFSNLIFMMGVYATRNRIKCKGIALFLQISHLVTAHWMFLYCYYIYKMCADTWTFNEKKHFIALGYVLPMLFALAAFIISPDSLEIRRFCFMSVENGMIFNYMLPVSILIALTTFYSLNGIRKINNKLRKLDFSSSADSLNALRNEFDNKKPADDSNVDIVSLRESKSCLKLLCVVQTGYDIVWFMAVLALENTNDNKSMAIVYAVTSCILNWYIFVRTKTFLPTIIHFLYSIHVFIDEDAMQSFPNGDSLSRKNSSDNIPLLTNTENGTELKELHLDGICTITTQLPAFDNEW